MAVKILYLEGLSEDQLVSIHVPSQVIPPRTQATSMQCPHMLQTRYDG
jgi:hypothetical protein